MITRPIGHGGTFNADFQCSASQTSVFWTNCPAVVMNSCKDGEPSQWWVVICLPGCRYFHVDVRELYPAMGWRPALPAYELRSAIAAALVFFKPSPEALWAWAKEKHLPRTLNVQSCADIGIVLDTDDLRLAATQPKAEASPA